MHKRHSGVERMITPHLVETLREKLVFDWMADFFFTSKGTPRRLEVSRFVYFEKETAPAATVAFVDGGMGMLFCTASFAVCFFRVSSVFYQNRRRIRQEKKEFYACIDFDEERAPRIGFFGLNDEDARKLTGRLEQYAAQTTLGDDLTVIAPAVLQFAEYQQIQTTGRGLPPGAVVVRDGSLDVFFEICPDVVEELRKKSVLVCGLAKTNTLRTTNGHSVSMVLEKKSNVGCWWYPISERVACVKLHQRAAHVFRGDVAGAPDQVFPLLAAYAADPVFLGYPYGLVEADRIARVSRTEAAFLRKQVKMRLGSDAAPLAAALGTTNAHEILDHVQF